MAGGFDWSEETDEILDECLDHFAVDAWFKPADGDWEPIASGGIFREVHRQIDPATGAAVTSLQPSIDVRRTELPHDDELDDEDRIFVAGRVWALIDVQKDGEVGARVELSQVDEEGP